MRLNILVLHNIPNFSNARQNIIEYVRCFERYAPDNNFLYHRWSDPVTTALKKIPFHLIILDSTALGICRYRPRELYYEIKSRWNFLADTNAVKLVWPQDDYHQSNVLDELFDEWNVDIIYSVVPTHMHLFYPRSRQKAVLKGALTGYIDDLNLHRLASFARPFRERRYDVGQRCTMYPPIGGRYARLKGEMAEAFRAEAMEKGFVSNISTDPSDVIVGEDWPRFLGDCRFVLGAEGGVSIWDPDGLLQDKVSAYLETHPDASFEDVEANCFPGEDMRHVFSAISPRLFEASIMGCAQILLEGDYLGLLKPFEHYIPVKRDFSDLSDAVDAMRDLEGAERRLNATREALIATPELRYSHLVANVMADVQEIVARRQMRPSDESAFLESADAHRRQLALMAEANKKMDLLVRTRLHRVLPSSVRKRVRAILGRL